MPPLLRQNFKRRDVADATLLGLFHRRLLILQRALPPVHAGLRPRDAEFAVRVGLQLLLFLFVAITRAAGLHDDIELGGWFARVLPGRG